MVRLSLAFIILLPSFAVAYTQFKTALSIKQNKYMATGVVTGGRAGTGSTLLKVRRVYSAKNQVERIILDLGDKEAKPSGRDLGYYQVALDSARNRVVVDLTQLRLSKISEGQIQALFRRDPMVARSEFTLDLEDRTGTLVLNFRKPVRVEVFQLAKEKQAGRIVIDVTPRTKI